jgi:dihydrofolate reductase
VPGAERELLVSLWSLASPNSFPSSVRMPPQLKEEFDGELQVPGSHRLVQELIEADLVDQINLMVFPVILGTGKRVFEKKPDRRKLRLTDSKVVGDGVLVLIYERAAD